VVRYLSKATGKEGIDAMDKLNSSTVLLSACEYLNDLTIVETLVSAGADVNAVNEDNDLPLTVI
jgi:ankyrin repeat protein